jgi:hypothetical protein
MASQNTARHSVAQEKAFVLIATHVNCSWWKKVLRCKQH